MEKRARLSLYLRDEKLRRQIKIAAAKRGLRINDYCMEAIERRLVEDGEMSATEAATSAPEYRKALKEGMDSLRGEIGPVDIPVTEMIKEGRRR